MDTIKTSFLFIFMLLCSSIAFGQTNGLGQIDAEVQKQINGSLKGYYALKDALTESSAEKASQKSEELLKTLEAIDQAKMTDAQKTLWAKLEKLLSYDARHIRDNKEIGHQRSHFMKLSNNMYALVFNFKANESESYLNYCPMKKASWLSESKDVKNPYYGAKMLDCGAVKATLKKRP